MKKVLWGHTVSRESMHISAVEAIWSEKGAQTIFSCRTFSSKEILHRNPAYNRDISETLKLSRRMSQSLSTPLLEPPHQRSLKHLWGSRRTLRLARLQSLISLNILLSRSLKRDSYLSKDLSFYKPFIRVLLGLP